MAGKSVHLHQQRRRVQKDESTSSLLALQRKDKGWLMREYLPTGRED